METVEKGTRNILKVKGFIAKQNEMLTNGHKFGEAKKPQKKSLNLMNQKLKNTKKWSMTVITFVQMNLSITHIQN